MATLRFSPRWPRANAPAPTRTEFSPAGTLPPRSGRVRRRFVGVLASLVGLVVSMATTRIRERDRYA